MIVRRGKFATLATAIGILVATLAIGILVTQPPIGMNTSALQKTVISVAFRMCAAEKACGHVSMNIAVNAQGWTTDGSHVFGDLMQHWTASCSDGSYKFEFNELTYTGTCKLSGVEDRVCFQMDSATEGAQDTLQTTQCFSFDNYGCDMDFKGQILTRATPSGRLDIYPLTSPETYSCVTSHVS